MPAREVSILFLIFNRPEVTAKVFGSISKIKPSRLYIAADGPRKSIPGDVENCQKTREIIGNIDWRCEVHKLFREDNLGCGKAVSSAINWYFEQEDEGIILEDDCLPDDSFYDFCCNILDYYRENNKIMHIGGVNFQNGIRRGKASYYFSACVHVWGWATWKRAWKMYDYNFSDIDEFIRMRKMDVYYSETAVKEYWLKMFRAKIDTWDYQWNYSVWNHGGLAVIPQSNLVTNIGFGSNATHTLATSEWAFRNTTPINTIQHPDVIVQNRDADLYTFYHHYSPVRKVKNGIISRLKSKIRFK